MHRKRIAEKQALRTAKGRGRQRETWKPERYSDRWIDRDSEK